MRYFLVLLATCSGFAANIVSNPSFESATFAPWVSGGFDPWVIDIFRPPHTGSQSAGTGCIGASCITPDPSTLAGAWVYQDLATIPGGSYTLDFWYASPPTGANPNELEVLWNGTVIVDLVNIGTTGWLEQIVNNLVATGSTTRLEFLGRNDPGVSTIDDVSVTGVAAPEPASWLLLATGLLAFVLSYKRTKRLRTDEEYRFSNGTGGRSKD